MVPTFDVTPGPDGQGWWPDRFGMDAKWADQRGTAWRTVTNHPTLQARRTDNLMHLRTHPDQTHTYRLHPLGDAYYLAEQEPTDG